ncbi:1120_t:CDS:2, partial [Racocetra fulgida]
KITTQLIRYKNNEYLFDSDYDFLSSPSLWWGVIEDNYKYLQDFAKIVFAIVPLQAKCELRNSALELTTYAAIENNNMVLEQDEVLVSSQLSNSEKLEIGSMVDLSNTNFGGPGNLEICHTVAQESGNMDFDPIEIVESEL